jgi:dienelactone hydrolase
VQNKTEQMFETLAWATAENARRRSPYFGRIDTAKVAVMGHSCGGLQAIAAASDPRVTTAVVLNSGIIRGGIPTPDGGTRAPAGILPASDADLPKIKAPMLYIAGGPTDQAQRGAEGDFEALDVPVFFGTLPAGHGGTWQQPRGGDMAPPVVAWLDWRLKGDTAAARMFTGADCGLCKDTRWTVKRKKLG